MKKFEVTGGLGRLCQFPKTVTVQAKDKYDAVSKAMYPIRQLITENDFNGDVNARMLAKVINASDVKELNS